MGAKAVKGFIVALAIIALGACSTVGGSIDKSIESYNQVKDQVHLGESKQKVLSLLEPIQPNVEGRWLKDPDRYVESGVTVEIYYFRSGRQADGLTTDDEFTPYIFHDGTLVGIG